jgi:sugar/nucleoside kinase (ribokinase family)
LRLSHHHLSPTWRPNPADPDAAANPITPFAPEIDATGTGDIFAFAFILALHEGHATVSRFTAAFAATSVATFGPSPLPLRAEIERRLAAAAIVSDDVERGAPD